jgi:hypothetical protein
MKKGSKAQVRSGVNFTFFRQKQGSWFETKRFLSLVCCSVNDEYEYGGLNTGLIIILLAVPHCSSFSTSALK